ncbi:hypothetical protein Pla110_23890 [Polystyrenella longa]|uniref:Glycosyl hydrolase family 32 N-terminal domain-containing protein n=1 Tax=Polystyrenella longa TaxID=2528007 RepID=A0A518CN59_9PLAN|nr:hypothetical protein [Polystyrenella longa]QDU80657.1 hypothetical protein Pla110_23890 [Polystyrenella longa]
MTPLRLLTMLVVCLSSFPVCAEDAIDIGDRRELLIDHALTEKMSGEVELRLHHPVAREVALTLNEPWEGNSSGYPTVIKDGDLFRMYYCGHRFVVDPDDPPLRMEHSEVTCYAESRDGIHWSKPNLNLFKWGNYEKNNIVWLGGAENHNFSPFIDTNPAADPQTRFKAVGGTITSKGIYSFQSADGIHWSKLSTKPIITQGPFDSHNTCFWDSVHERYCIYIRHVARDLRLVMVAYSEDFKTWTEPVELEYPDSPPQQMYTNHVLPYHRAPHILMGFPTRYVARSNTKHVASLPPLDLRSDFLNLYERGGTDLTDGLFMTSRDGQVFNRWDEAFFRPGPQGEGRWIYGDNYQTYGVWETESAEPGGGMELSTQFSEGYWRENEHQLRRYTVRLDGFVSLNAKYAGGELITKPVIFKGNKLEINYATSAAGSLRVELQDASGQPIPGFSLDDCPELFGDSTSQQVTWNSETDIGKLAGTPVRLRFVLSDGDLYSYRFHQMAD